MYLSPHNLDLDLIWTLQIDILVDKDTTALKKDDWPNKGVRVVRKYEVVLQTCYYVQFSGSGGIDGKD